MSSFVIKRSGKRQEFQFNKITERIQDLLTISPERFPELYYIDDYKLLQNIDSTLIVSEIIKNIPKEKFSSGIKTSELDNLAAVYSDQQNYVNSDYNKLYLRIILSNFLKKGCHIDNDLFDIERLHNKFIYFCNHPNLSPLINIDYKLLLFKTIKNLPEQISLQDFKDLIVKTIINFNKLNLDYDKLASRFLIHFLHQDTPHSFYDSISQIDLNKDVRLFINDYKDELNNAIIPLNDFNYNHLGITTLKSGYLYTLNNKIIETPQYMFMRVAVQFQNTYNNSIRINGENNINHVLKTYKLLSENYYIHATPTLFNSCLIRNQLASCYLIYVPDSAEGIMEALKEAALISKDGGGLGIHFNSLRGNGSPINGGGVSSGPLSMFKMFNETARTFNQRGKRQGSFAHYFELWHTDVIDMINCRLPSGNDNERARDVFPAVWMCDLFVKRYYKKQKWSLMCPNQCPNLVETYGKKFERLYLKYEKEGRYTKQVDPEYIVKTILSSQLQTGLPYVLSKDSANKLNMQMNLGTLFGSNLCCEITTKSSKDEIGVCNLASVGLPKFVENGLFNFEKLKETVAIAVRNLNRLIDVNYYPVEKARRSNLRHRPIAIGITGLWDVFMMMGYNYDSEEALQLNKKILENMYFAFLTESHRLATVEGRYSSFNGSPLSRGKFRFDLWNKTCKEWNKDWKKDRKYFIAQGQDPVKYKESYYRHKAILDPTLDWEGLRKKIMKDGTRNSLGIALMPTISTSNIIGFSESFECLTQNIYVKKTKDGEFKIINKYLVDDFTKLGIWNQDIIDHIIINKGSIENIQGIPQEIKDKYKNSSELSGKKKTRLSSIRLPFIDQTESLNTYVKHEEDDSNFEKIYNKLLSIMFHNYKQGLITISYYTHQTVEGNVMFSVLNKDNVINKVEIPNDQQFKIVEITNNQIVINTKDNEGCPMCE